MARKKRPDGVEVDDAGAEPAVGPPAPRRDEDEPQLAPSAPPPPVAAIVAPPDPLLEERLKRLEETLTQLQQIEQRLIAIQNAPVATAASPDPPRGSLLAGAGSLFAAGVSLLPSALTGRPSSLGEVVAELRAVHRMFVDPRYSMSWVTRLAVPLLLLAFVFSYYVMPGTSILYVGWWIERAWLLVIGYALFKVMTGEARRYRQTAPDLPPSLRL